MAKLRDIAKEESEKGSNKLRDIAARKETVHAGGTPLFDETTGRYLTPAEVLLRKHLKVGKK